MEFIFGVAILQYLRQNPSPPRQLHNELKSPINRTILALGHINAPPHYQQAA